MYPLVFTMRGPSSGSGGPVDTALEVTYMYNVEHVIYNDLMRSLYYCACKKKVCIILNFDKFLTHKIHLASILQLSNLYEGKPPISRAKMTHITKTAIKAIKFYKHVVQSVEKFIQKVSAMLCVQSSAKTNV